MAMHASRLKGGSMRKRSSTRAMSMVAEWLRLRQDAWNLIWLSSRRNAVCGIFT
jgi:hypothetical protein